MHLNISPRKWWPFCFSLNVLSDLSWKCIWKLYISSKLSPRDLSWSKSAKYKFWSIATEVWKIPYFTESYLAFWENSKSFWGHLNLLWPSDTICLTSYRVNIGSGNSLLSGGRSKPLPGPVLTTHQWGLVAFTWGQFYRKCCLSLIWIWKFLLSHISQRSMS